MGKVADGAAVNLEHGVGAWDERPAVLVASRRARAADGLGVEEPMVAPVRVLLRAGADDGAGVAEAHPLDRGILGAEVQGVVLGAVGGAEDVTDVVGAVDLVQVAQRLGAPDVDDGVAGAGEEEVAVGGEEEGEDAALVRLDVAELVKGGQGPGDDLAVLGAGVYGVVVGVGCEGEDGAAVLEAVAELGFVLGAFVCVDGCRDYCLGCKRRHCVDIHGVQDSK